MTERHQPVGTVTGTAILSRHDGACPGENGNGDGISNHDMFGRASEMQQNPLSTCVVQWRRRTRKHQINNHAVKTQARIHAARESHATNSNETADAPLGSAGSGRHLVMMAQSCDSARLFV